MVIPGEIVMSFGGGVKHQSDFRALFWSKHGLKWHVQFLLTVINILMRHFDNKPLFHQLLNFFIHDLKISKHSLFLNDFSAEYILFKARS